MAASVRQAWQHDPAPANGDVVNVDIGGTSTYGFITAVSSDTISGSTLVTFAACAYDGSGSITAVYDSVNGQWPTYLLNVLDTNYTNQDWKLFHYPNAAALKATAASFTGSINGSTQQLTVSSSTGIRVGQLLNGTSVPKQVRIVSQINSTTWQLSPVANTNVASEAMTTSDAITVTQAAFGDYNGAVFYEVNGASTSGVTAFAGQGINAASGSNTVTTGTAACGSSPGIMVAISANGTIAHSPYAPSAGTGFTSDGTVLTWNEGQPTACMEHQHFANPGTAAATWTPSGADGFVALMAFLPDASSGPSARNAASFFLSRNGWHGNVGMAGMGLLAKIIERRNRLRVSFRSGNR